MVSIRASATRLLVFSSALIGAPGWLNGIQIVQRGRPASGCSATTTDPRSVPTRTDVPAATPSRSRSAGFMPSGFEVRPLRFIRSRLANHELCIQAVDHIIRKKLFKPFALPDWFIEYVVDSWNADDPTLYGRFDFCYNGIDAPKLLEYNADTPTSLLEAAVVQWAWYEDTRVGHDQFNSIHDKLVATWKDFGDWIPEKSIAFTSADSVEDGFTLAYLQETAAQAGFATDSFPISELGWNGKEFVSGNANVAVPVVFKLYPWEWMTREQFAQNLYRSKTVWIEPAWKMLLSNKAILPLLWELFPDHPLLLEARYEEPHETSGWVRKPMLGREGNNVTIYGTAETDGEYGGPWIYQRNADLPNFSGNYPVVGSWIVGQEAAGMGIRESTTPITGNTSRFVPHVIE